MHPAYKHITDRLKIAELTIPQIVALFFGFMSGLVFALYLSPFSAYLTLCLSIYIAGMPAGAVVLAMSSEFDLWLYVKACAGEQCSSGRFAPGPGQRHLGYSIKAAEGEGPRGVASATPPDLGEMWGL